MESTPTCNHPEPVRVAFFHPHLDSGGVERIIQNLLIHLDRDRFRPYLILNSRKGTLLETVPSDVEILDFQGRSAKFAVILLARILNRIRPQVVYSGTNASNLALMAARPLLRFPAALLISEHTPVSMYLEGRKWRAFRLALMKLLYPRATKVAVPLEDVGLELRRVLRRPDLPLAVLANPVIPPGFDDLLAADPGYGLPPEGTPLLVSTGRLNSEKGFDLVLRALALLGDLPHPPHLVIQGSGPEERELKDLAAGLGLDGRVTFAGYVDNPYAVLKRAAAVVQASRREGFGNVLIEAMAAGVPVVATDCPVGPRVILDGGRAGVLVPPGDPTALAAGIRTILTDADLAARLRREGPALRERYTVSRTVSDFQDEFAALGRALRSSKATTDARTSSPGR
ncbi:MAG: glycosyltransferase [Candidatus Krumholzibacteriia bacterium]